LFAFVGPLLIPYGYDEFNKGAENLYPYHYTLEDTQRVNDEIASRTQSDVVDVDEMIAQAKAEAEKKGEKFTKKDEAVIRAKAKVAAKPSEDSSEEQSVDEDSVRKELGIKKHIFGYSQAELERKANGEKVFPHVFGTDMYGRDILVRVMYGARVSMSVGVFAAILVLVIGALYGAISGYCGGKVDAVMQRIVELIYAVPEMLVVLLIATALKPILTDYVNSSGTSPLKSFVNVLGPNLISMFIAFGLLYWVTMSRIIRGQVLQLKQQEYVTAARALGASGGRIIRRHLLPNCIGQIVVTTCLQIPSAIFLESFLSYLGVGVSAPLPSLGSMATDALSGMYTYTYRLIVPSVILSIMILAFNLFGDGLRDALDPKLKK
jgi:oligopeptide transport system permease protein